MIQAADADPAILAKYARYWRCVICALLLLVLPASRVDGEQTHVQMYANASVNSAYLTRNFLRAVFTLRVRTWPDGQPVRIFVLDDDEAAHVNFCQEYLGTYPYVLRKSWSRTTFTGTGLLPVRVDSAEEMRRRVDNTPGSIGYLPLPVGGPADSGPDRSPS